MIPGWSIARYVSFDHFVSAGEQVGEVTTPGAFAVLRLKVSSSFAGISTGNGGRIGTLRDPGFQGQLRGPLFCRASGIGFSSLRLARRGFGVYDPMSLDP